jgi:tetratricopeptide (TPR) repeat protein
MATLISLGVYLYTLAPDVTLEDSGELAVGSMYAGVPHPPGYPMWTIYSWVFTKILPFSNIAWRVAVSSAVAAALSCGLLALMISRGTQLILSGLKTFKSLPEKAERGLSLSSGLSAGLIFGFNGFIWSQAVIVEVYTLGILTFALTLALLMRWFYRPQQRLYLYLAYFVFGLCFVNHQTLILAAIGMELMILLADPKLGRDFLAGNCVLYLIGLVLSLKGAEHGSAGNPGLFILFNLVGAGFMALLIGLTVRFPSNLLRALAATAFLAIGLIFGLVWSAALDKSQFTQANTVVKLWTFINLATLCGLIAYSWINRDKDSGEDGLLSNWMPLLNTRAAWIIAALLYFYMPIASMTNPPMNWAYPRTTQGFKHAITRGQYDRITPSNFTRMFLDSSHTPTKAATPNARTQFNGGQLGIYLDEATEEFSLSYVALGFVPLAFLYRMRLKEFRWILGLTGIYVTFTLILIYLINPTADELNRHLNKVFFAATHIFIAGAIGLGLALIGATLASYTRTWLIGVTAFLGGLALVEGISTFQIVNATVFAMEHAAAYIGWGLLGVLLVIGIIRYVRPSSAGKGFVLIALATFCLLPLRPALNNWAENEQRNHLFGYWYGHDMFTPPFDIYPEMDQDAILFGGTDPGRFCPTYFIFCESFIAPKHKRDPDFDRRDVYIITQNALADATYLQYIRAHYNPSTQTDPHFFQELAAKINDSSKRMLLNGFLFLGLLAGLAMALYAYTQYETHSNRRHVLGVGVWGGVLLLGCFLGFSSPLAKAATSADKFFTGLGDNVDTHRRAKGIYPEKEIHTPSVEDNQIAFAGYYASARERLMAGTLQPGEDVRLILNFQCTNSVCQAFFPQVVDRNTAPLLKQLEQTGSLPCQRCKTPMAIPEPQVSVTGTTAVMDINARLAKTIFEENPDHEFYVEESFPLAWMYPHLRPAGIIMKLGREPIDEFDEAIFTKDRRFWQAYSERLIGDWITEDTPVEDICNWIERTYQRHDLSDFQGSHEFIRDNDAQKGFSKLRAAIAGLYTWRSLNTKDPTLRQRYQREAHFAYRQAIAFGPINPETVFKFINLLTEMGHLDQGIRVAQCYYNLDPANPSSKIFIRQAIHNRTLHLIKSGQFDQAIESTKLLERIDPEGGKLLKIQLLENRELNLAARGEFNEAILITERLQKIDPAGNHLIRQSHYKRQATNEEFIIDRFEKSPANPTNFVQAIYIHGRRGRTNEILTAINTFNPLAGEDPKNLNFIKNAYGLIQRWEDKAVIDEKLTTLTPDDYAPWFDLAQTRLQLQQTNHATQALKEALTRFEKGTESSSAVNIIDAIRTNAIFAPLREHPEIKPFLEEAGKN